MDTQTDIASLINQISVLEKQKRSLERAVDISKRALETCRNLANRSNDGISFDAADKALAAISEACQEVVASATNQSTYMTTDQARDWAWKALRRDLDDSRWNVGESSAYFGFFLHGWNNRGQYEVQRRVAVESAPQVATIN